METIEGALLNKSLFDREMAIQEVTKGYELAIRLQSLLPFAPVGNSQSELAGTLFREILQALDMALSVLKSSDLVASETSSGCLSTDRGSEVSDEVKSPMSGCRKRARQERLTEVTFYYPHDDGYQWRKYGQKNIQKGKLVRKYYRCTYKEQGCKATKLVEQQEGNPTLYRVTYNEEHACKVKPINPQIMLDALSMEPGLLSFDSNGDVLNQQRSLSSSPTSDHQDYDQKAVWQQTEAIASSNYLALTDITKIESVAVQEDNVEARPCDDVGNMFSAAYLDIEMACLLMDSFGPGEVESFLNS